MEYKILGFDATTGSASVNFFTAEWPSGLTYNVDIPVENGAYIGGQELADHIMSFAPYGQIARLVALRDNPPSAAAIPTEDFLPPPAEPVAPPIIDPILDVPLAESILNAENAIDRAAAQARARFISSGTGQDGVYVVKGQQAEAYAAAGFTGPVPSYIAKEAEVLGITAQAAAENMLAMRDVWNTQVGPQIEGLRIGGKKKVRVATTVQGVDTELRAATQALQAIKP